jgi:hypothetical protein
MAIERLGVRKDKKEKNEEMKKQTLTLNVACLQKFLAFSIITGTDAVCFPFPSLPF